MAEENIREDYTHYVAFSDFDQKLVTFYTRLEGWPVEGSGLYKLGDVCLYMTILPYLADGPDYYAGWPVCAFS